MFNEIDINYIEQCFKHTKILVIGDIFLDEYFDCNISRISPEAPIPIAQTTIDNRTVSLGGAANTALNCKLLGAKVTLSGIIGKDITSKEIKRICKENFIKMSFKIDKDIETIKKTRFKSNSQQILRVDYENKEKHYAQTVTQYEFMYELEDTIKQHDIVILSDYNKGTLLNNTCEYIIGICNQNEIPVFVDPKSKDFSKYSGATCITPNFKELKNTIDKNGFISEDQLNIYAKGILKENNIDIILITRGKDGLSFVTNSEFISKKTDAEEVYDVSGAGDTVIATFAALFYASVNISIEKKLHLANLAAKIVIKKQGTQAVSFAELEREVSLNSIGNSKKIVSFGEMNHIVSLWKSKNLKIVMTNGCFDLLHDGHMHSLQKASELGDKLIVAVNSDEAVKKLKGSTRPIVNQYKREYMLSSLACVDLVISFENEDELESLIECIIPDFLVKGSDYVREEIIGYEFLKNAGKRVEIINSTSDSSTTKLIETIRRKQYD